MPPHDSLDTQTITQTTPRKAARSMVTVRRQPSRLASSRSPHNTPLESRLIHRHIIHRTSTSTSTSYVHSQHHSRPHSPTHAQPQPRDLTGLTFTTSLPPGSGPSASAIGIASAGFAFSLLLGLVAFGIGVLVWTRGRHISVRARLGLTMPLRLGEVSARSTHTRVGTESSSWMNRHGEKRTPHARPSFSTYAASRSTLDAPHTPSPVKRQYHARTTNYEAASIRAPAPIMSRNRDGDDMRMKTIWERRQTSTPPNRNRNPATLSIMSTSYSLSTPNPMSASRKPSGYGQGRSPPANPPAVSPAVPAVPPAPKFATPRIKITLPSPLVSTHTLASFPSLPSLPSIPSMSPLRSHVSSFVSDTKRMFRSPLLGSDKDKDRGTWKGMTDTSSVPDSDRHSEDDNGMTMRPYQHDEAVYAAGEDDENEMAMYSATDSVLESYTPKMQGRTLPILHSSVSSHHRDMNGTRDEPIDADLTLVTPPPPAHLPFPTSRGPFPIPIPIQIHLPVRSGSLDSDDTVSTEADDTPLPTPSGSDPKSSFVVPVPWLAKSDSKSSSQSTLAFVLEDFADSEVYHTNYPLDYPEGETTEGELTEGEVVIGVPIQRAQARNVYAKGEHVITGYHTNYPIANDHPTAISTAYPLDPTEAGESTEGEGEGEATEGEVSSEGEVVTGVQIQRLQARSVEIKVTGAGAGVMAIFDNLSMAGKLGSSFHVEDDSGARALPRSTTGPGFQVRQSAYSKFSRYSRHSAYSAYSGHSEILPAVTLTTPKPVLLGGTRAQHAVQVVRNSVASLPRSEMGSVVFADDAYAHWRDSFASHTHIPQLNSSFEVSGVSIVHGSSKSLDLSAFPSPPSFAMGLRDVSAP